MDSPNHLIYVCNHTRQTVQNRQTGSSTVGNNVSTESDKNMPTGNVTFKTGTVIELRAPNIVLDAGTKIEKGCVFKTIN